MNYLCNINFTESSLENKYVDKVGKRQDYSKMKYEYLR